MLQIWTHHYGKWHSLLNHWTHCGLVVPYDISKQLVKVIAWRHAITQTNANL